MDREVVALTRLSKMCCCLLLWEVMGLLVQSHYFFERLLPPQIACYAGDPMHTKIKVISPIKLSSVEIIGENRANE